MKYRAEKGFTLFELMVTVMLVGLLAGFAVPNMRDFFKNNRLSAMSNDLLHAIQRGRSEAVKRQRTVVVCASGNPTATNPTCAYADDSNAGWMMFEDANNNWQADSGEEVIQRTPYGNITSDGEVLFKILSDNDRIFSFNQFGFANPDGTKSLTNNIVLVDSRGIRTIGNLSTARAVLIAPTGNARVSRDPALVAEACKAVDLSENCT